MQIITKINQFQKKIKKIQNQKKGIGFVPTMGAFHEGHLSLMRKARRENDVVVVSIFVNPKQFGPKEDFTSYPRQKKEDVLLAKKENVDIIFYPSVAEMYPTRYFSNIEVSGLTNVLCGKSRAGHFKGVTTVVGKLLNIVQPSTLYLGQKDAQQCVVLKQMVTDLNWPTSIKVLPIIREKDGLALSSRNKYLGPKQRAQAPILFQALKNARAAVLKGERRSRAIKRMIRTLIQKHSNGRIEYVECVDAQTLVPLKKLKNQVLIALAVSFGTTRLIDNIILRMK